jgi:hypothetical protein
MLSIHELIPDLTQMNVERNREKLPDENVFDRKREPKCVRYFSQFDGRSEQGDSNWRNVKVYRSCPSTSTYLSTNRS